jgi:hypothetical protein
MINNIFERTTMSETDTLHLWFRPYGGVINESDVSFIERYSRRFDISRDTFMKFRSRYKEIDKAMKEKEIRRKGELQKRRV